MWRPAVLLVGTAAIVLVSRRSLLHPRTHGFYRFFALELLLVLVVLNAPHWFAAPGSPRQLVSWSLLVLSVVLAAWAFHLFHAVGHAGTGDGVATDLPFERTTRLITTGVYRYLRHPMYASLCCLAWGAALKRVGAASIVLALLVTGMLVVMARVEERENLARFGDAYARYMGHTWRFIPCVF